MRQQEQDYIQNDADHRTGLLLLLLDASSAPATTGCAGSPPGPPKAGSSGGLLLLLQDNRCPASRCVCWEGQGGAAG
jgi:hypothetical protein